MCRPVVYNLFVFVRGQFAGLLSPTSMTSRLDSSSGVVRMPLPVVTAEFVRYGSTDPARLPASAHRPIAIIETAVGPVVAPVEIRAARP